MHSWLALCSFSNPISCASLDNDMVFTAILAVSAGNSSANGIVSVPELFKTLWIMWVNFGQTFGLSLLSGSSARKARNSLAAHHFHDIVDLSIIGRHEVVSLSQFSRELRHHFVLKWIPWSEIQVLGTQKLLL